MFQNPLFYISKLNHTFSCCFHGAQCLVCRNPCSSMRILQKNMELRAGNRDPKKTMELLIENAQLTENPMKCIVSFGLNNENRMILCNLCRALCLKKPFPCSLCAIWNKLVEPRAGTNQLPKKSWSSRLKTRSLHGNQTTLL